MAQVQQTDLLGKYAKAAAPAAEKAKTTETNYGNQDPPAGIEGGIAQLIDIGFRVNGKGKQNEGETHFYAVGIVKSPKTHKGLSVEGSRTSIMEMLCDTPTRSRKTVAEHTAWIANELKKLGMSGDKISFKNWMTTCAILKKLRPHFKFRTALMPKQTQGKYKDSEPRVFQQWLGAVDFTDNESAAAGVVEDTPPVEHIDETSNGALLPSDDAAEPTLDELLIAANGNDSTAQEKLQAMAISVGVEQSAIDEATDWEQVAALIQAQSEPAAQGVPADENAEETPTDEPWVPKKGDAYNYLVIDPKTNKPLLDKMKKQRPPVEVEVTKVNVIKKTVDLKNLVDGKTIYLAVAWDKLSGD